MLAVDSCEKIPAQLQCMPCILHLNINKERVCDNVRAYDNIKISQRTNKTLSYSQTQIQRHADDKNDGHNSVLVLTSSGLSKQNSILLKHHPACLCI